MSATEPRSEAEESLRTEVDHLGRIVDEQERLLAHMRHELFLHSTALGWRLERRMDGVRRGMLAVPGVRQLYRVLYRALEIWADEGLAKIFVRTGHKIGLALRGRDFLVDDSHLGRRYRFEEQYDLWLRRHGRGLEPAAMRAAIAQFTSTPVVSVLAALDDPSLDGLSALRATLGAQSYERWELCVALPRGARAALGAELETVVADEPRLRLTEAQGERPMYGDACGVATGEFMGMLDVGDELAPSALFELVRRLDEDPQIDIVYSDEDAISPEGRRSEPFFKPDWSPDLLLSTNYLVRFGVFRRSLIEHVGGFRAEARGAQAYALVLRVTEATGRIAHVPRVLCHQRRRPTTVDAVLARHAANREDSRALMHALVRRGRAGRTEAVYARGGPRCFATRFDLTSRPLVSIIIPTRNKRSLLQTTLESIWQRTDYDRYEIVVVDNDSTEPDAVAYLASLGPRCQVHQWKEPFNYSAINNFAVRHARGEQLLFLNNDMEIQRSDWLTALLEHAQRPEVGAVGARLLYGDGRIQHAGVVVGINRAAANAFRKWPGETIGSPRLADLVRNCSAVTGACMMVPRRVFTEVGGFNERLRVVLNDVDLCLRIRQKGYLVVYTPHATLNHYEGASRGFLHPVPDQALFEELWDEFLRSPDPYYNPNLTRRSDDWSLHIEEEEPAGEAGGA